ncbi:MAG: esterase-like activity of phytase family protein [Paracoccaceae bacterium]
MNALAPTRAAALRHLTITLSCGLAWLVGGVAAAYSETIQVLDQVVLGEERLDGEKVGEFSALVMAADGSLLAISDRGYMVSFAVDTTGDRLAGLKPVAVHMLTGPDGTQLRGQDFNPEAATLLDDGTVAIVSEAGPRLAVFDPTGKWLRDETLPEPLRDAGAQASEKDGIEALTWTPTTGFVAMTEEPQLGQPRNVHTLYTTLAGSAQVTADGPESISIKGMEAEGSSLFILERTRDNVTDALQPFLRIIELQDCLSVGTCVGRPLPIMVDGITDADFEGLAALGDGRFLMVSDDKIDGDLRSVFVLFKLE